MNRRFLLILGGLFLAALAVGGLGSAVALRAHWGDQHESAYARWHSGQSERRVEKHRFGPFGQQEPPIPAQPGQPDRPDAPFPAMPAPGRPAMPDGPPEMMHGWEKHGPGRPFGLPLVLRALANVAVLFGLGLLLRTLAPLRFGTMLAALAAPPRALLRHGLTGLAAILAAGALSVLAVISVLGVPLVPVLIFGTALSALVGVAAVAAALGQRIRSRSDALDPNPNADLLLGLLVFALLALVPGLNLLALGAVALLGLGVVVTTRGGTVAGAPPEAAEPPLE